VHPLPHPVIDAGATPLHQVPLWLLTVLAFSSTVGMYIFLPALPFVAQDLAASAGTVQLTISLYIAGLAAGQLVYGPASDRFGRRPVLVVGLLLFTAASLVAAWASRVDVLLTARLLQGFGGSVGLVLGRAMVRDTAALGDAARRLALMNLMVTLGPGLAPIIGAILASTLGWRAVLLALALLGIANLWFSWRILRETRPAPDAANSSWAGLRAGYVRLLRSPVFLAYAIGGGCATTAVYGFFAAAPFILVQQMGRSGHEVGWFLTMQVSGLWFGSMLATRLVRRHPVHSLVVWANAVSLAMGSCFLLLAASGQLPLMLVAPVMFLFTVGVGLAAPTALAQAINVDPAVTGAASGIYGCSQMTVGALCSALVGLGADQALSAGLVLVGAGTISLLAFWVAGTQGRARPGRQSR
jgi:DHA1 family bicyclomycin/chloramphenicol resistance-like MFS transporter